MRNIFTSRVKTTREKHSQSGVCLCPECTNLHRHYNFSSMKKLLPILLGLFWQVLAYSQPSIQPGCVSGNFGIDADVNANRLQFITGTPGGTDDWFKVAAFPGAGIGVIDTTGAAALFD